MEPITVAIVEDEKDLQKTLVYGLSLHGVKAIGVDSAADLWPVLDEKEIEVVVLDLGLPDEDGISVALRLQEMDKYGVIMATGRSIDDDRILGFQCGADQYFVKPINIKELAAATSNLAKKITKLRQATKNSNTGWHFNSKKSSLVTPSGVPITLTLAESTVVAQLFASPGECVSRTLLLNALGLMDEPEFYSRLENVISRIRSKVSKVDPKNPIPILPRRGIGYIFLCDE